MAFKRSKVNLSKDFDLILILVTKSRGMNLGIKVLLARSSSSTRRNTLMLCCTVTVIF
jgi:hypothetical protein